MRSFTEEQAGAVARREGPLLLAAGAGSGKTSVLVERFVRSVLDDGLRPGQILAITFTEKAAGELRSRVRARFLALGEREAARETESAWIGTIHGFCTRVLRGHAVAAGLDPAFVVLDDTIARELRATAWRRAYATWIDDGGDAAVDVAAAYGVDRLEEAIGEVHDALRSAGATVPALPSIPPVAPVAEAREAVRRAIPAAQAELAAAKPGARVATAQEAVLAGRTFPTYKMEALCGPGCTAYRDAVERLATAERDERAAGVAARLGDLLTAYATAFADAKTGEGRAGLRRPAAPRPRPAARRRVAARLLRGPLRARHGRRVPGHEPAPARARRPPGAGRRVRRRGRAAVDLRLPPRGRRGLPRPPCGARRARRDRDAADELPLAAGDPRGGERRVRAALRRRVHGAAARAGAGAVDRAGRGAPAHRHGRMGRRGPRRSAARAGLAPRGGAAAGPAGRRARRERRGRAGGRRRAAARRRLAAGLRARAAGRRAADAGGRRPRVLGPPGRARSLRLARDPRQPARRDRALRRAGLAARRGVDRRPRPRRGDRPGPAGPRVAGDRRGVPHGRGRRS